MRNQIKNQFDLIKNKKNKLLGELNLMTSSIKEFIASLKNEINVNEENFRVLAKSNEIKDNGIFYLFEDSCDNIEEDIKVVRGYVKKLTKSLDRRTKRILNTAIRKRKEIIKLSDEKSTIVNDPAKISNENKNNNINPVYKKDNDLQIKLENHKREREKVKESRISDVKKKITEDIPIQNNIPISQNNRNNLNDHKINNINLGNNSNNSNNNIEEIIENVPKFLTPKNFHFKIDNNFITKIKNKHILDIKLTKENFYEKGRELEFFNNINPINFIQIKYSELGLSLTNPLNEYFKNCKYTLEWEKNLFIIGGLTHHCELILNQLNDKLESDQTKEIILQIYNFVEDIYIEFNKHHPVSYSKDITVEMEDRIEKFKKFRELNKIV